MSITQEVKLNDADAEFITLDDGTEIPVEQLEELTRPEAEGLDESVEAVVAQYDAGGSGGVEGDVDRRAVAELEEAFQEICRYGVQDEDGWWRPEFTLSFQTLATEMAEVSGQSAANLLYKIQDKLVAERFDAKSKDRRRRQQSQVLGEVSLDLDPSGQWVQDQGHPAAPCVIFLEIDPHSHLYRDNEVDADGVITKLGRTAMAVWFQPEIDDQFMAVDPKQGRSNGRWYSNDTFKPGYLGVVAWFPTLQDADDAHRTLRRSVFTIGKAVQSARQHDTVQDAYDDPDDADAREKRAAARRRRTELAF